MKLEFRFINCNLYFLKYEYQYKKTQTTIHNQTQSKWQNKWKEWIIHIHGLMQKRRNSSALTMELCFSCTNPSICASCSWNNTFFDLHSRSWLKEIPTVFSHNISDMGLFLQLLMLSKYTKLHLIYILLSIKLVTLKLCSLNRDIFKHLSLPVGHFL